MGTYITLVSSTPDLGIDMIALLNGLALLRQNLLFVLGWHFALVSAGVSSMDSVSVVNCGVLCKAKETIRFNIRHAFIIPHQQLRRTQAQCPKVESCSCV